MYTTAIAKSGYRNLPLSMLDESSTNPRRTFEPSKLVELAHSLTVHGLIQPITVRPKGDRFEVVAGARRFRAANDERPSTWLQTMFAPMPLTRSCRLP